MNFSKSSWMFGFVLFGITIVSPSCSNKRNINASSDALRYPADASTGSVQDSTEINQYCARLMKPAYYIEYDLNLGASKEDPCRSTDCTLDFIPQTKYVQNHIPSSYWTSISFNGELSDQRALEIIFQVPSGGDIKLELNQKINIKSLALKGLCSGYNPDSAGVGMPWPGFVIRDKNGKLAFLHVSSIQLVDEGNTTFDPQLANEIQIKWKTIGCDNWHLLTGGWSEVAAALEITVKGQPNIITLYQDKEVEVEIDGILYVLYATEIMTYDKAPNCGSARFYMYKKDFLIK